MSLPASSEATGGVGVKTLNWTNEGYPIIGSRSFQYDFDGRSTGVLVNDLYDDVSITSSNGSTNIKFSQSPSVSSDLWGNHIGYGRVRETLYNGSYIDYHYQGFGDFPDQGDISQAGSVANERQRLREVSYSHKRGLLKKVQYFNKNGKLEIEQENVFGSLTTPEIRGSYGFIQREYNIVLNGNGFSKTVVNDY